MTISRRRVEVLIDYPHTGIGGSVTQRVGEVTQIRGGFLRPKDMTTRSLGDGIDALNPNESVSPALVGMAVDYLTRTKLGTSAKDAFRISRIGAKYVNEEANAYQLLSNVTGLDDKSVICAVKLCGYDVCYRASIKAYKPVESILPDAATIENIIVMVRRSLSFFEEYGPMVLDGFDFDGGYTKIVSNGDGDFTTADTLWEIKTLKGAFTKDHTLQLLMYWRMGLHSIHTEFKNINYLGIFNPRLNTVSRIAVADIPDDVIKIVETKVIGYEE